MTELAAALKEYPLYSEALAEVNPQYARRVQLENLLRQSLYTRYDSLCRYDRSAGSKRRFCKPVPIRNRTVPAVLQTQDANRTPYASGHAPR